MFGMGTGVSPPVRSPENFKSRCQVPGFRCQGRGNVPAGTWNLTPGTCFLNSVASFLTFAGHQPSLKKGELLTVDC